MDNKALSEQVGTELRKRGQDGFRMTYAQGQKFIVGVGVELQVNGTTYRNAWRISDDGMTPAKIADRAAEWMDSVRAAPEKYRAA